MGQRYDPKKVQIIVGGLPIIGYASGTMISVSYSEDKWSMNVGAQGDVTTIETHDETGELSITLKQDSPSTRVLNELARNGEEVNVTVQDLNNESTVAGQGFVCRNCVVERPDWSRGDEVEDIEYTIKSQAVRPLLP